LTRLFKTLLNVVLVTLSSLWLGNVLFKSLDDLRTLSWTIDLLNASSSIAALVISAYASAYVYYLILKKNESKLPPFYNIVAIYFMSRLVRYLPGRIWLYIYQVNKLSDWISARSILFASFEEFFLTQLNTVFIFLSAILLFKHQLLSAIFCYIAGIILCTLLQRNSLFFPIISFFYTLLKRQSLLYESSSTPQIKTQNEIVTGLQLEWFFYLISWYLISPDGFTFTDIICLSSTYAVAWIIGFLAIIMPGGLIVREASFIWLCTNLWSYEQSQLIFFSLLMRLLFIFADILSFLLSFLIKFCSESTKRLVK
jgi:glycosyltransferase 2 family protein